MKEEEKGGAGRTRDAADSALQYGFSTLSESNEVPRWKI